MKEHHKKESPILSMLGFGGGGTGTALVAGGASALPGAQVTITPPGGSATPYNFDNDFWEFNSTGTYTMYVTGQDFSTNVTAIGGGGGKGTQSGTGAGGGGYSRGTVTFKSLETYVIVVGDGGPGGSAHPGVGGGGPGDGARGGGGGYAGVFYASVSQPNSILIAGGGGGSGGPPSGGHGGGGGGTTGGSSNGPGGTGTGGSQSGGGSPGGAALAGGTAFAGGGGGYWGGGSGSDQGPHSPGGGGGSGYVGGHPMGPITSTAMNNGGSPGDDGAPGSFEPRAPGKGHRATGQPGAGGPAWFRIDRVGYPFT